MSYETRRFYQRLAQLLTEKKDVDLSEVSGWLKTKINFSLIRSMALCLRGTRSKRFIQFDAIDSVDDVKFVNKIASISRES